MDSDEDQDSSSSESEYERKEVTILKKKKRIDPKSKKCRLKKRGRSDSDDCNGSSSKRLKHTRKQKDASKKNPKKENLRCCPHLIPPIIENLNTKQQDWVRKIGWEVFLQMPECKMPKHLTMWLVRKVDTVKRTLNIGKNSIPIDSNLKELIGLPNGEIKILHPKNQRTLPKAKKADPYPTTAKFSENGHGKKLPKAIHDLMANDDEEDFCRSFVMVMLALYLAPGTGQGLNRGFLANLMDVKQFKDMNWCDFIVEYLMTGIQKFITSPAVNVNLTGCVHILHLVYIKAIRSPHIVVQARTPTLLAVTTELLDLVAQHDQNGFKGSIPKYGLLMSKVQDEPMYLTRPSTSKQSAPDCHGSTSPSEPTDNEQYTKALQGLFLELKMAVHQRRSAFLATLDDSDSQICDQFLEKAKEIVREQNSKSKEEIPHPHVHRTCKEDELHALLIRQEKEQDVADSEVVEEGNSFEDIANIGNRAASEIADPVGHAAEEGTQQQEFRTSKDDIVKPVSDPGSTSGQNNDDPLPVTLSDPNRQTIGNELFYKRKYKEAAAHYTEAIKKNPNEPAVYRNRAQCHIFLGALPEGLEDAEKCIELDPTYLMGYVCKAKVQALMQNYESAMATYIEGLKCDPNNHVLIDGFNRCMTCIHRSNGGDVGREDLNDILRDWHSDIALCTELIKNMEEVAVLKKEASDERLRRIESERMEKSLEANQVQQQKEAAGYLSKIQQELQQVKARQDEVIDELQKANEHNELVQQQLSESKKRHIVELQKANEHIKNVQHQLSESKKSHIEELQLTNEHSKNVQHQLSESIKCHIEELQKANEHAHNVRHQLSESKEHYNQLQSKHGHLLKEQDTALKEVEKLRRIRSTAMPCQFSSSELERATENFSASRKIREGGIVSVYRGVLRNIEVEIKVLTPDDLQGHSQFAHEVAIHGKVRHPNIVTLLGACPESSTLVYELLTNGSLEDFLSCADKRRTLAWEIRVRVIAEICSALIFLHQNKPDPIVHGDLKPANILLDANLVSKLSHFDISHMLIQRKSKSTKQPVEDPTYMDPEYLATRKITPQSDVYSLGIVVLRLLTGKPPAGLKKIVEDAIEQNDLKSVVDSSAGEWPEGHIYQLAYLALSCTEKSSKSRPVLSGQFWKVLEEMRKSKISPSLPPSSSMRDESSTPSHFNCPISLEIMKDPQITADGFTYEGDFIRRWLVKNDTSPMTKLPLRHRELIPNRSICSAIQEWLQQHKTLLQQ